MCEHWSWIKPISPKDLWDIIGDAVAILDKAGIPDKDAEGPLSFLGRLQLLADRVKPLEGVGDVPAIHYHFCGPVIKADNMDDFFKQLRKLGL
jgi:hypothetical protein